MTRLILTISAATCVVAALKCLAETDPFDPAPADPNKPVAADVANERPAAAVPLNPDATTGNGQNKPAAQDETAVERAARFKKLLRSEVIDDMRWLWDTQFAYPEHVAKMEADYDQCLDEERYQDGEKIAAELLAMHNAQPQHILLSVWEREAELCRRAAEKEFGAGPNRRQAVAKLRWKQIEDLAQAEAKRRANNPAAAGGGFSGAGAGGFGAAGSSSGDGAGFSGGSGAVAAADPAIPLLYLFLRALNCAARHDDNIADEITRGVKAVIDNVSVSIPVSADTLGYGFPLISGGKQYFQWSRKRMVLRDVPADLLLYRELINIKPDKLYVISPIEAGSPFRRFQLGTSQAAQIASQKASDAESQQRIATTLKELFPTETIEVHVVRSAAILRAALGNPVHEQQIVSIANALGGGVLNQMTVNSDPNDRAPGVEKLELIGKDSNGLREVLAKLYPKEHIEVHVLPINNSVVLRGHLSRPEYAQQVYDIANTSYGTVLYQMTPDLPVHAAAEKASSAKALTKRAALANEATTPVAGNRLFTKTSPSDVEAFEKIGNATIIRMTHPDIEGVVVDELRTKFGARAKIYFGPRLDSISVEAAPKVIEEVRAAATAMEPKKTGNPFATMMGGGGAQEGSVNDPRVASIPTTDVQEAALDREARELAMKFRVAKLDEQPGLRRQLEQLTERHFDQRQERRQREIDDLAHRVDVLRVTHQRRGQNRATVIQQRVQDLLDPNADLRWDELQTNEDSRTNAARRVGTAHQDDAGGNPFGGTDIMVGSPRPTTTTTTTTEAGPTKNGMELGSDAARKPIPKTLAVTEAELYWAVLGFKLEALSKSHLNQVGPKYRGGMRIFEIRPDGPAAANDIQRGDILVGLDKWETTSPNNVDWILSQNAEKSSSRTVSLKYIVIRNGETRTGSLSVTLPPGSHGSDLSFPSSTTPARPTIEDLLANPEPTFDGTAYSEWLKMLDTERKPEKLAAAMDACSRLAATEDVPRIVRSILAAAEPFETAETSERMDVLSTGCRGLGRLLNSDTAHGTDFVFAEVQSRIDNGSFIGTHGVVCLFLSALGSGESLVNTDAPIPSLQLHAAPIIAALLRHHAALKQFDPRLADAATGVWMLSKAPIDDFEGLRPFVMKGFESRIVANGRYWPWRSLKSREYAVQLPETVTILTEQFDKKPDVLVRDLGALGPLAEPAVPKLVARLVAVWKTREEIDRGIASGRNNESSDGMWVSQMGFVFEALQKIGPKAKAAVPILKEFLSICPADQDRNSAPHHRSWMKSAINETLHAIGDTAVDAGAETSPLLSDFSHLMTNWKLTSSRPGQMIEGIQMSLGYVVAFSGQRKPQGEIIKLIGLANFRNYVIDESTTPKQITLVDKDRNDLQQSGIYELKGDRLKIEFAQPGLARPKEFSADREKLPEGHVLLEFERGR